MKKSVFSFVSKSPMCKSYSCPLNCWLQSVLLRWGLQCSAGGGASKQTTGSVEEVDGRVAIGDQSGLETQTLQQLNLHKKEKQITLSHMTSNNSTEYELHKNLCN